MESSVYVSVEIKQFIRKNNQNEINEMQMNLTKTTIFVSFTPYILPK